MARMLIFVVVALMIATGVYVAMSALRIVPAPSFLSGILGIPEFKSDLDPEERVTGTVAFIPMERSTITVFRKNRIYRHLSVDVTLQVHGDDNIDKVTDSLIELQGVVVSELGSYINLQLEESGEIDIENVKKRIARVIDNRLGKDTIRDVLIGELFMRRPR